MQFDYDDVKTTIRDHPTETVAVVTIVGLAGAFLYQRSQKKKLEAEIAKYKAAQTRVRPRLIGRRRPTRYVVDFAA